MKRLGVMVLLCLLTSSAYAFEIASDIFYPALGALGRSQNNVVTFTAREIVVGHFMLGAQLESYQTSNLNLRTLMAKSTYFFGQWFIDGGLGQSQERAEAIGQDQSNTSFSWEAAGGYRVQASQGFLDLSLVYVNYGTPSSFEFADPNNTFGFSAPSSDVLIRAMIGLSI